LVETELYLGLDIGTKNIKAVILSSDGCVLEKKVTPIYDLVKQPRENFVERDPKGLWKRIKGTIKSMKYANQVVALCVDATSGTIVPIDKKGKELYPLIMYNDSRAVKEANELREKSKAARDFEKYLPITPQLVLPKLMWLKKYFENFRKIFKILHESDYIVYKLTDSIATSPNVAGKSHALLTKLGYLEEAYKDVEIPVDIMPKVYPIGSVIGHVEEKASKELGIPSNIPVINGVTDASAGDITSGALYPGQASVTIGTSLTVHAVVDMLVPDPYRRFYYKVYVNDTYLAGGFTNAGTTALDTIGKLLDLSINELTNMASRVPPGSEGLISCTEWYGVRVPRTYPSLKGFIMGLSERNVTPGHIFRSLLEGCALALRLMLTAVEDVTGTDFYDLRISGGASRNSLLMQIIADTTGKTVKIVEEPDSALGSAILAAWGSKGRKDIAKFVHQVVKIKAEFTPDLRNKPVYDELAGRYESLIERIADLF